MKSKLILIVVLGLLLRLSLLSVRPLGFTWDEAALGYNAYSLLLTGHDEHGQLLPLIFKSFGDYKPGLYIYYAVLPIKIFGLNEFSTRLPSAIFGTLSIILIFLLFRYLTPIPSPDSGEGSQRGEVVRKIGLFSSLLLAINPWAIHFSRGAWEANLSLFLTLLATVLFFRRRWLWSALFFGLTFWSYQGAKLFTPSIILILLIFNIKLINIKKLVYPLILIFLLLLPILINLKSQSGRLQVFSVFSYRRSPEYVSQLLAQDNSRIGSPVYYLFHTEAFDQFRGIVQRFLNHLSPRYLFIDGDWSNPRHSIVYHGYFYYFEALTLVLGIIFLVRFYPRVFWLLAFWIIAAIIPSALSRDIISGIRSLPEVIPLTIISSAGLAYLLNKYSILRIPAAAILLFSLIYFSDLYLYHNSYFYAKDWLSVYQPAVALMNKFESNYDRVYFSDQLGQPYIFVLFYTRYPPDLFQKQAEFITSSTGDVGKVVSFGKYKFGPVYWPSMRGLPGTLFIGGQYELPENDLNQTGIVRLGDIKYPNGGLGFRLVGT